MRIPPVFFFNQVSRHAVPTQPKLPSAATAAKNDEVENFPIDIAWARSKIDLTLGRIYRNSEIDKNCSHSHPH